MEFIKFIQTNNQKLLKLKILAFIKTIYKKLY